MTCGKCGSNKLNDLGHGKYEATVICFDCYAHYWKKWYTRAEWEEYINAPDKIPQGLQMKEYLEEMSRL